MFERGDIVWVQGPGQSDWHGIAVIHSVKSEQEVWIRWIPCNPGKEWQHANGSDAIIPSDYCELMWRPDAVPEG